MANAGAFHSAAGRDLPTTFRVRAQGNYSLHDHIPPRSVRHARCLPGREFRVGFCAILNRRWHGPYVPIRHAGTSSIRNANSRLIEANPREHCNGGQAMGSTKSTASTAARAQQDMSDQCLAEDSVTGSSDTTVDSTLALLRRLGLHGMAAGFRALDVRLLLPDMKYTEWLAILLEKEKELRDQRRFERRSRAAKLGRAASIGDAEKLATCGLESGLFRELAAGEWIRTRQNVLVAGPAGVGKTWLSCALGRKALVDGYSVVYHRLPRLLEALALARTEGRYNRMLRAIARLDLLILDDLGPERLDVQKRRDLLEIIEDRYESRSTIVISPLPVDSWHSIIGDSTIAVSIFDRLVHNSHRIALNGESLRAQRQPDRR
jgi:DNA replication protein DnaC